MIQPEGCECELCLPAQFPRVRTVDFDDEWRLLCGRFLKSPPQCLISPPVHLRTVEPDPRLHRAVNDFDVAGVVRIIAICRAKSEF